MITEVVTKIQTLYLWAIAKAHCYIESFMFIFCYFIYIIVVVMHYACASNNLRDGALRHHATGHHKGRFIAASSLIIVAHVRHSSGHCCLKDVGAHRQSIVCMTPNVGALAHMTTYH